MSAALALDVQDAIAEYGEEAVRTAARHAMWRAGDLSYLLHEGREPDHELVQRYVPPHIRGAERRGQLHAYERIKQARETGADTFVLKTGRQWGKSLDFSVITAEMCVLSCINGTEPVRIPYAAPSAKQVDEFITPHFQMLQRHAPPELRPEHNTQKGSWIWPNGSRVVVAGCEDKAKAERLRGPRAHMAVVDEAGFIPIVDYVIESVLGWQLATTGGLMLLSSTPPVSMDHPFVTLWNRAREDGLAFESTTPEAPHMTRRLIEKVIKRCGGEHTIAWKREGLGMLIADPDKVVFPEFVEYEREIVGEHPRPECFLPHVIADGGHEDLAFYLFGYYDFRNDLDVIEAELVFRRARSDEQDAAVAALERELWPGMRVHRRRIDAPPQTRADLSRPEWQREDPDGESATWQGVAKPPSRLGSFNAGVNESRVRISRRRVLIHPRCRRLIAHVGGARWDKSRTGLARVKDSQGDTAHHYDGAAAFVYFMRDLDRATNPYPVLAPGVTPDTHHIGPGIARDRDAAKKIQALSGRRRKR